MATSAISRPVGKSARHIIFKHFLDPMRLICAVFILLLAGMANAYPSDPYEQWVQVVKDCYLSDTNAQILTHGNMVEIYVTNPQENTTMQGLNDLQNSIANFSNDLAHRYNNITTVTSHIEYVYKGETMHYTVVGTIRYHEAV